MDKELIISVAIAFIVGAIIFYLFSSLVFSRKKQELSQEISTLKNQMSEQMINFQTEKHRLEKEFLMQLKDKEQKLARQKQELDNWQIKWEEAQSVFKEKSDHLQKEFELKAQKIFEEKSQKFTEVNTENISRILTPFQEAMKAFKEKVEENEKESFGRHKELQQQLKNLQQLNQRLSEEANNLTRALKGDSKTQGIWGETILMRLLEKSGLEKGREYQIQQSFEAVDSSMRKRVQPDVVIYLPDQKIMIIDAKVSLTAYERYINSDNETDQNLYLKQHLTSVKAHINILDKKSYDRLFEGKSPEFILMFIPVEPAFSLALKEEPGLYDYAFERNIIMVTPSTLLATLKIIENMWRNEKQQQNALLIAKEAGALYDKFAGFITDLEQLEKRLKGAHDSLTSARKKLYSGGGNLIGKVEKLKKLGAKTKKQIPENWDSPENDMLEE